jgi:hypothetical protein
MSARLDPDLLAAYADGQLSPDEAAKVERQLEESPEDRRTVENLREMNMHLASAFEAPLRAPLSPRLRKQLAGDGRTMGVRFSWPVAAGSALAASIALAAGYLVGNPGRVAEPGLAAGELAPNSALHALLESGREGNSTSHGHGTASIGTTFIDGRGEPCRDVEWFGDTGESSTGAIACRRGEGWLVEIAVSRPAAGADKREAYVPAAGATEAVMVAALEALEAGPVLGPDEVDLLIGSDWKTR